MRCLPAESARRPLLPYLYRQMGVAFLKVATRESCSIILPMQASVGSPETCVFRLGGLGQVTELQLLIWTSVFKSVKWTWWCRLHWAVVQIPWARGHKTFSCAWHLVAASFSFLCLENWLWNLVFTLFSYTRWWQISHLWGWRYGSIESTRHFGVYPLSLKVSE